MAPVFGRQLLVDRVVVDRWPTAQLVSVKRRSSQSSFRSPAIAASKIRPLASMMSRTPRASVSPRLDLVADEFRHANELD